jgi:hypothetical protein
MQTRIVASGNVAVAVDLTSRTAARREGRRVMTWKEKQRQLAWEKLARIRVIIDDALAADRAGVDPEKVLDELVELAVEYGAAEIRKAARDGG